MMNSPSCLEDLKEGAIDFDEGDKEEDLLKDFDRLKFIRGQKFFQNHVISCLLAMTFSLVCGLSVNNLLEVLVATGKSSKPRDSLRRYMRTALHLIKWHYGEIWNTNTSAGKSIRAVRQMHDNARQLMVEKSKNNRNYYSKKVWLSQYDMSLVQYGFMRSIVMYSSYFGIWCSKKDVHDYGYFWMWVGRFLGIQDRNNICLGGYDELYSLCKEIETNVLFPALKNPPSMFKPMVEAFIEGVKQYFGIKLFSSEAIFMLTFEAFGEKWDKPLSISDRLRVVVFRILVNSLYYIPGFSWCTSRLCAAILGWSRLS